jgi:hypothetical protein
MAKFVNEFSKNSLTLYLPAHFYTHYVNLSLTKYLFKHGIFRNVNMTQNFSMCCRHSPKTAKFFIMNCPEQIDIIVNHEMNCRRLLIHNISYLEWYYTILKKKEKEENKNRKIIDEKSLSQRLFWMSVSHFKQVSIVKKIKEWLCLNIYDFSKNLDCEYFDFQKCSEETIKWLVHDFEFTNDNADEFLKILCSCNLFKLLPIFFKKYSNLVDIAKNNHELIDKACFDNHYKIAKFLADELNSDDEGKYFYFVDLLEGERSEALAAFDYTIFTQINKTQKEDIKKTVCGICFDQNCTFSTKCNHYFCEECLKKWINDTRTCPNCRAFHGSKHEVFRINFVKINDNEYIKTKYNNYSQL